MEFLRRLAFRARSALPASLPAWSRVARREGLEAVLDAPGRARLRQLQDEVDLSGWEQHCSLGEWRESLWALDVVRRLVPDLPCAGRCLDVGAKNGAMLAGLATAVPLGWDAVELDAHRRYAWGATRRAYGERAAAAFSGCRFVAGDVRTMPGPYALITWFLPFLTPGPVRAWGLPAEVLQPEPLLRHVVGALQPGGRLLVVNQGAEEASLQAALFERCGLHALALGPVVSAVSPYRVERWAFLYTRRPNPAGHAPAQR